MRYFGSFFITLILYASTITTVLYSFNNQSNITKNEEKKSLVKISLIEPKVELKKEKEIIKEQKNEPKKIKKKISKKVKKTKKKIEKKVTKPKPQIKKEIKKIEPLSSKKVEKVVPHTPKVNITKIKNDYIEKVKKTINKNKFYPNSARRRGIEGYVNVNFIIGEKGELKNIKILNGKKIFYNAAKEAIVKSFPINTKKNNHIFPLKINLCIKYNLN
ncbi:TonB family protein [Halarcobacter sp.]|uniref:TonB family protein n=1 Tax=Halarcobacter sp. TaxID=2321133 RepID=UPI0029F51294|nr:TonB family protein [Halarcobacter sp.]